MTFLYISFFQLPDPSTLSELEQKLGDAQSEASQLKDKLTLVEEELEASKSHLHRSQMDLMTFEDAQQEQKEANIRLKEKLSRLEVKSYSCVYGL